MNQCSELASVYGTYSPGYINLTNGVLANVSSWGSYNQLNANFNGRYNTPPLSQTNDFPVSQSPFEAPVGAGNHYLATYRDSGTTNINADLLAALKKKTTYPPIVLTNTISVSTNLVPQAWRDDDSMPDLGYHYDVLDFITSLCTVTNATLTLTNGVAIGSYNEAGIWLQDGSHINCVGSPTALNRLVRYSTVQEQPVKFGTWALSDAKSVYVYHYGSAAPAGLYRFTEFSCLAGGGYHLYSYDGGWQYTNLVVRDSLFRNGSSSFQNDSGFPIGMTNNLFERSSINAFSNPRFFFHNNLVRYGEIDLINFSTNSWVLRDNSFDNCTIVDLMAGNTNGHNAYIATTGTLSSTNATDVFLTGFTYTNGPLGNYYQVSTNLWDKGSVTNAALVGLFHHVTRTNQVQESNSVVDIGFHYLALSTNNAPVDTDGDGLPDYFEDPNGNGIYDAGTDLFDWNNPDTDGDGLGDLQEYELLFNVLVNDPAQDYGNEQNSQFESTVAVVGNNVIVAWVDSNQGVYNLGFNNVLPNYTPRLVSYAVSRDGGVTFEDKGVPPLSRAGAPTSDDGDAGDPVLAVDRASASVYLAGTSPRNDGYKGIPVWKSTDGGATFNEPIIVRDDITQSDKPWIALDDWAGTGQHDVYLACIGNVGASPQTNALWLTVSTNGYGTNWSMPTAIRQYGVDNVSGIQSVIPLVGRDHTAYAFWFERTSNGTNWLKMRQVLNRGATMGDIRTVRQLATTNSGNGNLELKRSNSATNTDTFRVFPFPVPAVSPATNKPGHLYVAYADRGANATDKADVFFVCSTDAGTNWTSPQRVNTDATTNDQWMPVLCVKPDGAQLFMAWYDRRNDTNNSLIDLYGRFATIATNGSVSFGTEFLINTTNFPPVFAGTDTNNTPDGHYDPVYPPGGVNLHWWYPDWPLTNAIGEPNLTPVSPPGTVGIEGHVGEYNGAWAENEYVYISWTDYRLPAIGISFARNQGDVRFVRFTWPQN